jgi:hypothetical protein
MQNKYCEFCFIKKNKTMITQGITKETEIRLKDFFTDIIETKEIAKKIRQVNHVLSLCNMRNCETVEIEFDNLEDNFYWLNKLAEALDPYLDVE